MIQSHEELEVYQLAFDAAMRIFAVSKGFPREETYSLTDQMRRSSRSVCSNIAAAWRARRYEAAFVSKPCPEPVEGSTMPNPSPPRRRRGSTSPSNVAIFRRRRGRNCIKPTITSLRQDHPEPRPEFIEGPSRGAQDTASANWST